MRILQVSTHVAPAPGLGGVAVSARNLHEGMVENGHEVVTIAAGAGTRVNYVLDRDDYPDGVRLYRTSILQEWGVGWRAIPEIASALRCVDLVYVNGISTFPTTVALLMALALRKPVAVAPRGGLMPQYLSGLGRRNPGKWALYLPLRWSLQRASALHVTSPEEERGIRCFLRASRLPPIVQVPNASSVPPRAELPRFTRSSLTNFGVVGRVSPEKGQVELLESLTSSQCDRWRVVFAGPLGKVGAYTRRFEGLVREDGRVSYCGELEGRELLALYDSIDYLLLPSGLASGQRENFGNVVVEALSRGVPIVASAGLYWDRYEHRPSFSLFPARAEAVVATVESACDERESLEEYAVAAHDALSLAGAFSREAIASDLLSALWDAVRRKGDWEASP